MTHPITRDDGPFVSNSRPSTVGFFKRAACLAAACLLILAGSRAQNDDALPALVEVIAQSDDPQFQFDLLKGISDGLKGRREVGMPRGWDELAAKLRSSSNPGVRDLVQSLSLTFGSQSALAELRRQMMDPSQAAEERTRALNALLSVKDPQLPGLLRRWLKESGLRGDAIRALAAYDDPQTPDAILAAYPGLIAAEKRDALNTLASRAGFASSLLAAVQHGVVPARDLTADIVRQLRGFKDERINARVTELWGVARESGEDKLKEIAAYKAKLQKGPAGDPSRGRVVFARICQQCHTLFDLGGKVGPDITGSNRADLDYILHNILDPNAEIPNDYRTSTVDTKDDRVITGILTAQSDAALTIVTANDTLLLPRSEVQAIQQSSLSMMPEGLAELLSDSEMRDLIAYLKSPEQVALPQGQNGGESRPEDR